MGKFNKMINKKLLKEKLESNKDEADRILSDKDTLQKFLYKVIEKVKGIPVFGQYLEEIPLLCNMVLDFTKKRYNKLPRTSIISITAALLYFLSPIDLIPDFIIGLGLVDDAFVIKLAIDGIRHDISEYKEWKENNEIVSELL